jgi:hypothetical protein
MGSPLDVKSASGGAGSYAATGATVGSVIPGIGTVAGGAAGAVLGIAKGAFGGGTPHTSNGGRDSTTGHLNVMTALIQNRRWHDADAEELWYVAVGGTPPTGHVAGTLERIYGPQTIFSPLRVKLPNGDLVVVGTGHDTGRMTGVDEAKGGAAPNGVPSAPSAPAASSVAPTQAGFLANIGGSGGVGPLVVLGVVAVVFVIIARKVG